MGYATASSIAKYCHNLLGSEPTWTVSTCPTKKQVDSFLSTGCAVLETILGGKGYTTPVASGTAVYGWLGHLEEMWGAAHAEFHRTNITLSPGERTRGMFFYEQFWMELDRLMKQDLTMGGAGRSGAGKIYAGGISIGDKQAVESNTDLVTPRFFRGVGRVPNTLDPQPSTASTR